MKDSLKENETNSMALKYFNLKQISNIWGLHYETTRTRCQKLILGKYKNSNLIRKVNRIWQIDYKIIHEFEAKRTNKNRTKKPLFPSFKFNSVVTVNPESKYSDVSIFKAFTEELKNLLPKNKFIFSVEDDFLERGKNMHVNIISDTSGLVSEIRDKIDLYFGKCRTYEYKNPSKWHVYNYLLKANLLNEGDDE
jgi:hypothetical protein